MMSEDLIKVRLKTLVSLAKPAAVLNLHHTAVKSLQSGGYISRFKGRGMEFDETRLYQPGDDIRSIDWRVTARTGKTHTKLYREERERPVFISVDNRPTMQFATRGVFKSVQAAKLAALLAWTAQQHGDRIGGQVYSHSHCNEIKPQNGKHGVLRFFNALLKEYESSTQIISLQYAIARLSQHARPGSLVYIISDFRGIDHQTENFLAKLSRHCEVVLVLVFDPLETHLPEKGRYRFTDNNKDVYIDSNDPLQQSDYQNKFHHHQQALENLAKKLSLKFLQSCTTDNPIDSLR